MNDLSNALVLVVGAGTMGTGIAQVAAQRGHRVYVFDVRSGAAAEGKRRLARSFEGLVTKGKISSDEVHVLLDRVEVVDTLSHAADAGLAVEAVVEHIDTKRAVLGELERILAATSVIATNTSSISVTALAKGMQHPERLVGMHFFNPVPVMKLVEVVSGLHTATEVAQAVFAIAKAWGKMPVQARSTPGFIANRIARPFYAETLMLLQERAAEPQVLDACMRGAGFRMGPCELMDLIGHDTNFAVTRSLYEANFFDKRYVPSPVQQDLIDGGLLGRKSGRGFYRYPEGAPPVPGMPTQPIRPTREVVVHGKGVIADAIESTLASRFRQKLSRERSCDWVGLAVERARLVMTDGRSAKDLALAMGNADVAVFDRVLDLPFNEKVLAYAVNPTASRSWHDQAPAWLAALGFVPQTLADTPGLVVARTVAMLINEACDAVLQGVCTEEGADAAMRLGVNYPAGPFEWLHSWGVRGVTGVIEALDATYRGERYRTSRGLAAADALTVAQRAQSAAIAQQPWKASSQFHL